MPNGQLPEIALIHGWGIGRAAWQPVAEALAGRCRVHLVDLPGYGGTPPDDADFSATASNIVAGLPEGVILCGWSLGGLLALQAVLDTPARVAGLILVGASPSFTQRDDWPHAQPLEVLEAFAAAVAGQPDATLQRFNALLNQGDVQARACTRRLTGALAAAPCPDVATLQKGLDWLRGIDLRPQLARLERPITLIHGERDPLMPIAAAQWMHATLPGAALEIVPGAAHAPFINTPETVARRIGDDAHVFACR